MVSSFSDDMRQVKAVAKNEIRKFIRGRKLAIFLGLIALVLFMITVLPYVLGDGLGDNPIAIAGTYIGFVDLFVLLASVFFSATSLVSEFEERTALILFTKPIKKSSIFLGKFLAAFVIVFMFILIYYVAAIVVSLVLAGTVASGVLTSAALALLYIFSMVGVSFMISAISKKGSTASIMVIVFVLLVLSIASGVLQMSDLPDWWILSATDIFNVIDPIKSSEPLRSAVVMVAWGVITSVVGYILFKRKDF